jgi:DMSO/TMAO reductase YedYZ molybdopterin-dependent catalytic subunit/cytochrome c553
MTPDSRDIRTDSSQTLPRTNRRQFLGRLLSTSGAVALAGCELSPSSTPQSRGATSHQTESTPPPHTSKGDPSKRSDPVLNSQLDPALDPLLPDGLNPRHFTIHNLSPLALESKRSAIGSGLITPISRFFIRNNLPRPDEEIIRSADAWTLEVLGVKRPGTITLAALKGLGLETEVSVIQCSGNGRQYFEHGPSGSPWSTGAAGCAMWTGVRVSTLLKRFGGVEASAQFLTSTGGEPLPEGLDPTLAVVERSIPIEKALKDCLLAWEMNSQPIPITHGGPLRLIVPGYFGCNQIKYVKTIAATPSQSQAKIQSKGYRFRPIGEPGAPNFPSLWRMPVKSWLIGPGADGQAVLAGDVHFYGVALSGERGVTSVEVSLDEGDTWSPATLEPIDLGPNAWRPFKFSTQLKSGTYTLFSRATDRRGERQPKTRVENERGYRHHGWYDHGLTIEVVDQVQTVIASTRINTSASDLIDSSKPSPGALPNKQPAQKSVKLSEAGERGRLLFERGTTPPCGVCHTVSEAGVQGAVGPNLDLAKPSMERLRSAMTQGVGAMPSFAQTLSEAQIEDLATYVFEVTK